MEYQDQMHAQQQQQAQQQIEAQQRQIEALQRQKQQPQHQPQHEDPAQKLQKYADLKQKGLITDEEYQKLKADLLSKI
jgi:multidrug resistance efflux pump